MQTKLNSIRLSEDGAAEVMIYDEIGASWFGEGVTAKGFADQLKSLGKVKQIDVRINSPGGSVFEGLAIYNILAKHKANVTVYIDGLAASIATVIAMAGDQIEMAENAMFMIHEPHAAVMGTAGDMKQMAETLERLTESAAGIYVARSGQEPDAVKAAMSAETWYTAEEAKNAGFVSRITANKQIAASFDSLKVATAPAWVQARLQAEMPVEEITQDKEPEEMAVENPVEIEAVDVEAVKAQAKADERERQTKIVALCAAAKRPELSSAWCEDGSITVVDVQAKLFEAMCKSNAPLGDEGGTACDAKQPDENDKYRAEFKATAAYAKSMTEQEYIEMRRIDDGLDSLKMAGSV